MHRKSRRIAMWRNLTENWSGPAMDGANSLRKSLASDDGSTVVETAVSAAIVLMLLFGVFDISLAFYTLHYVSDAAREGARYAIVRGSDSCSNTPKIDVCQAGDSSGATEADISAFVAGCNAATSSGASTCGTSSSAGLAYPGMDNADYMTVKAYTSSDGQPGSQTWTSCGEITGTPTCNSPGDQIEVQVTYSFPLSVPFWRQESIQISSTSKMLYSQ